MSQPVSTSKSPLIIGVSGHRDLHESCRDPAARDVGALLDELVALVPNTPLRVIVGMAAGADMLVAAAALARHIAVDALLPMPLEEYAKDFSAESLAELRRLLAHPNVTETVLAPPPGWDAAAADGNPRDALYVNLSDALVRKSNLLIALWNGESAALPGGTTDTVIKYLAAHPVGSRSATVSFVDEDGTAPWERQLVYWVPVVRNDGRPREPRAAPCFISGAGEAVLRRHPAMPPQLRTLLVELDHYNREFETLQAQPYALPPDTLMRDVPATISPEERADLRRIDIEYGKADALAVFCQLHSHRLFRWFSYMASAMGLLFLIYAKLVPNSFFLFAYLATLLLGLGVFHALKSRHWFSKHLAYRALAETMRTRFFLRLTSADRQVSAPELIKLAGIDQFEGFGWITHVLRSIEPFTDRRAVDRSHEEANMALVRRIWIDSQLSYFKSKVGRLERTHKRLQQLKMISIYFLAAITVVLIVFAKPLAAFALALGFSAKDLLLFLMGLLPVWLGIWELYEGKMATRELLWQYRNQLGHFSRASIELAQVDDQGRRASILADLGKDSLMESYLWTIHRYHREHEPPAAG